MTFPAYRCDLCFKYHVADQIVLLRFDWSEVPLRLGVVGEWYAGVRALCVHCVKNIKDLPILASESA